MNKAWVIRALEIVRWTCVVVGFQWAFAFGKTPPDRLHILTMWLVFPLAGLTGIESLFFGRLAREATGYAPSAYQRQSGMNNLATGLTGLMVVLLNWGVHADATIMTVLLTFLILSGGNHAWSAIREGNHRIKNLLRPIMTALLAAFTVPVIVSALSVAGR